MSVTPTNPETSLIAAALRPIRAVFSRLAGQRSLTRRLLALIVCAVLLAEVLFYPPSIVRFRDQWLAERINAAMIASLSLDANPGGQLPENLRAELLARAGVLTVSRKYADMRNLVLAAELPAAPAAYYDLDNTGFLGSVRQTLETLLARDGRVIRVSGKPQMRSSPSGFDPVIDMVIAETPLRHALLKTSMRILWMSLAVLAMTAAALFVGLDSILIRPIGRLIESMLRFREAPEDAARVIHPSGRSDELGAAEQALAAMQEELRAALNHKSRLAALGTAMSKINHDLRNMLAAAQLVSDRLAESQDPAVQREAPKLMRALDRAITLTSETLRYGQAQEPVPKPQAFRLADLVDEVVASLPVSHARIENKVDRGLELEADPDQVYRMLFNLSRNAIEALDGHTNGHEGHLIIGGQRAPHGGVIIEIADDGPGIPPVIRTHLFEPFATGKRSRSTAAGAGQTSGTGLGLAISRELARGHGGDITLVKSDDEGTVFRIILPDRAHFH